MNETITQTAHMTSEIIINKCKNIHKIENIDSEDIDFIHAWDELMGAYGILKDYGWDDMRVFKYLETCKHAMAQGNSINFNSVKRLK